MEADAPLRNSQRLCALAAVACYLLIVLGAVVRVTDSGEGCPGWPLCYGVTPLWRLHSVIEYTHHVLASAVAVLVVLAAVAVWIGGRQIRRPRIVASLAIVLLIVQLALGGITVLTHLSGPIVALHLATALALLGTLLTLALLLRPAAGRGGYGGDPAERLAGPRHLGTSPPLAFSAASMLVLTYATAIAGALLVGTESDLACATWPACSVQSFLPRTAPQALSFAHRLGVVLVVVALAFVAAQVRPLRGGSRAIWLASWAATAALAAQALIGALTIWLNAPPLWEGLHVAGAAAVWAAVVVLAALVFLDVSPRPTETRSATGKPWRLMSMH